MRVFKQHGTKEKLFEMMERVNKVSLKEGIITKSKLKEFSEEKTDINQEIYDELEMRYSPTSKTIYPSDIQDVINLYDADDELVAQIASDVINDMREKEIEDEDNLGDIVSQILKEKGFSATNNVSLNDVMEELENMYVNSEIDELPDTIDVRDEYNRLTKDPKQMSLFEGFKYNQNQHGNWIPKGLEDKMIALRPVELPIGSGNHKVHVVTLTSNGELDEIVDTGNNWDEADKALVDYIS